MLFGVPGLKKASVGVAFLVATSLVLISCSSSPSSSSTTGKPSGLKVRAFISNPLLPSGTGGLSPVLNIVDATLDELSPSIVNLSGASASPGLMALSPSKRLLLVFSNSDNTIAVVDTTTQAAGNNGSSTIPAIRLPDTTQSMVIGPDNATGYAAVPAAPVTTSPPTPGAIEVFSLASGAITSTIPVPGARFVAVSHNGNRVLALGTSTCSDNTNSVTVIAPSLIGTSQDPRIAAVCGFDHPVWAAFSSDDTKAYILDCGPECGGTTAAVSRLDLNTNTVSGSVALANAGATVGLQTGSTLYVAGTPPGTACGSGTAAPTCGTLQTVDVGSMTVSSSSPILITDGNHDRMDMGANGQLFIGATGCSSVNTSSEVRGCLSIFDTNKAAVVIPPEVGDVTGIQPITNRNVVYICQNLNFRIYDTTTDKLEVTPPGRVVIVFVGQAIDVKLVD
jgi:hypothetical protein